LERLSDKQFLAILSCQGEDVDDYAPARFDVGRLSSADVSYAHHDILFDLGPCRQVMQHDLLKGMQEVLLEVEACKLLLEKELIGKLSQGVNCENGNVEVLVGAHMDEVFTEHLPNTGPDESDSSHVEVSYLDKGLQTELSGVYSVIQLLT
jgi:hypothetical protein